MRSLTSYGCDRRRSQGTPEPRIIGPEKPHLIASSLLTTAISTLRCLKMRLSITRLSASSNNFGSLVSSQSPISVSRSEEHTSELQSLMRISYAVYRLQKKNKYPQNKTNNNSSYIPQPHLSPHNK